MRKFFAEAKASVQKFQAENNLGFSDQAAVPATPTQLRPVGPPTPDDVIRFRYHHGTNLGSVFVLERWLSGSMFLDHAKGGSELDAVRAHQESQGLDATRAKWEEHWRNAVSEDQLRWLVQEAKCTSIRLPIGYFTLGPQWCRGTPFEAVADVYVNAWNAVREFTRRAKAWGIGTLVDFHAVYGGANGEEHSGTTSGRAELWESRNHQEAAKQALKFIAEEIRNGSLQGVVGIQLVNEATHNANGMYRWYEDVIYEISCVDDSIPIYISDSWDLKTCLDWINARSPQNTPRNPVIIDTHKYYTFSDLDRSQAPQQIIARLRSELSELDNRNGSLATRGAAQVIVGEWSCVLDTATWSRVDGQQKDGLVREFGNAQSRQWQARAGGAYFWTYKMDWMPGGEWGFEEQTRKGNIFAPPHFHIPSSEVLSRVDLAQTQREVLKAKQYADHENYWNSTNPGKRFEHHLYASGWDLGFSDALLFSKMRAEGRLGEQTRAQGTGCDKIGCLDVWLQKRVKETGVGGEFAWEWEHGFRKGVESFSLAAGI